MHVVFLHGIGDGNRDYDWLDGLNRGLTQAGFDPVDRADVLEPALAAIAAGSATVASGSCTA